MVSTCRPKEQEKLRRRAFQTILLLSHGERKIIIALSFVLLVTPGILVCDGREENDSQVFLDENFSN